MKIEIERRVFLDKDKQKAFYYLKDSEGTEYCVPNYDIEEEEPEIAEIKDLADFKYWLSFQEFKDGDLLDYGDLYNLSTDYVEDIEDGLWVPNKLNNSVTQNNNLRVLNALKELYNRYKNRKPLVGARNVYLAAPWFNEVQGDNIIKAVAALYNNPSVGHIHIPLLHQYKGIVYGINPEEDLTIEWANMTYKADVTAMNNSDLTVAVHTVGQSDDGTSMEIGYTLGNNKPVVTLYNGNISDEDNPINLMLSLGATSYVTNEEELEEFDFMDITPRVFEGKLI